MQIITKVNELLTYVERCKEEGKKIGLVPTMGALHPGHLSLVKRCREDNDVTIVSLFVNPTQFNNKEDLATYPRNQREDCAMLAREGVDIAFAPKVEEIYPEGAKPEKEYNLGHAEKVMEGKHRPGHFQGVAQIVDRLFRLCRPDRAYFGMKDFQQIIIIKNMVVNEGLDVEIVACPIVREANGLALSSRNQLLTPEGKRLAPEIHKTLADSVEYSKSHSVQETRRHVVDLLNSVDDFKVEYYSIVDGETLLPVEEWDEANYVVGCITVYVGRIRLIDNIEYRKI